MERAMEIVSSLEHFDVSYDGHPIIIQNIDEKTQIARVYLKDKPDSEMDVPIRTLTERKK